MLTLIFIFAIVLLLERYVPKLYQQYTIWLLPIFNLYLALIGVNFLFNEIRYFCTLDSAFFQQYQLINRFSGNYSLYFWWHFIVNIFLPQIFWIEKYRMNRMITFFILLLPFLEFITDIFWGWYSGIYFVRTAYILP